MRNDGLAPGADADISLYHHGVALYGLIQSLQSRSGLNLYCGNRPHLVNVGGVTPETPDKLILYRGNL